MIINVAKIRELKRGGAILTVDFDEEAINLIKFVYKRKRWTKQLGQKAVLDGLNNYIKKHKLDKSK